MFGWAFDAPPMFTFSATASEPNPITVGVAEWIRDEQGMWVGAILFFKNDGGNCVDPLIYGELLRDPGFELHKSYMPVGPNGEEFVGEFSFTVQQPGAATWTEGYFVNFVPNRPWFESGQIAWDNLYRSNDPRGQHALSSEPPASTKRYGDAPVPAWIVFSNNGLTPPLFGFPVPSKPEIPRWFVSDEDPDVGSKQHARIRYVADTEHNTKLWATALNPIGFEMCRFVADWPPKNLPLDDMKLKGLWTCRALPGDTLTFSVRAKSNLSSDPLVPEVLPWLILEVEVWNSANFITSKELTVNEDFNPSTSYETYSIQAVMPALAEYVGVTLYMQVDGPTGFFQQSTFILDVDNCSLMLEPAAGNEKLASGRFPPLTGVAAARPEYEITVKFGGQTLKGYGNIHDLDSAAAPTEVVLT
jgi:hypothetical protein